ncbi:2-dehydropantoate 2-reductase [Vibrio tritonius]|uniref:2-dehydropantoate 2-reductase n=1 Tax=Vibrio tritonius TaxID=1435069 RepID=UPI000838FE8F|nr:2-dehydropantoate 2-reductase [Vibrio tritonius]
MNIVVVGPGAIGSLWAYHLHQAGHRVSLWHHTPSQSGLYPLSLCTLAEDTLPTIDFTTNDTEALKTADLLLVTVKAWQLEPALLPLIQHLHPDTIIVCMQNGMGATDSVYEKIQHFPLVLATTTHGAFKTDAQQVCHSGLGQTMLGAANLSGEQCTFLAEVFNHALSEVLWVSDIRIPLWNKLAINCVINPLTAIHQCPNGALDEEQFSPIIKALLGEIAAVMSAESLTTSLEELSLRVHQVIVATKANHSSMKQDIAQQRRTEIDFITGYLIQQAQQHHIAVPNNLRLFEQIKQMEQLWIQA